MARRLNPEQALNYGAFVYTRLGLDSLTQAEAKAEYIRLRAIAKKRIARLEKAGFSVPMLDLPTAKNLTPGQLANALMDVARFIRSRRSTVTGYREEITQRENTLRQHYPEINWDEINMSDFYAFMEEYSEKYTNVVYPSDEAVKIYAIAKGKGMTTASLKKDLAYWVEHKEDLVEYNPGNKKPLSSATIRKRIAGK